MGQVPGSVPTEDQLPRLLDWQRRGADQPGSMEPWDVVQATDPRLWSAVAAHAVLVWRLGAMAPALLGLGLSAVFWHLLGLDGSAWALAALALAVPLAVGQAATIRAGHRAEPDLALTTALWLGTAAVLWLVLPDGLELPLTAAAAGAGLHTALAQTVARLLVPAAPDPPVSGWTLLNSAFGYGSFIVFCLILPLFAPLLTVAGTRRQTWIIRLIGWAMRRVYQVTPTVAWRSAGALEVLEQPGVVVSNHEGMLDILSLACLPGRPRILLAKGWVFRNPVLALPARAAGALNVDDLDDEEYLGARIAAGPVGMAIFPEGRRSRDGALARFRPGAAVIARAQGLPLLPVAQAGSRLGIAPGSLWIRPTAIDSVVLPALPALADETNRAWMARVRATIAAARHAALVAGLGRAQPRLARAERFIGLPPGLRARCRNAESALIPALLTALAAADTEDERAPWLVVGAAGGAVPAVLQQFRPAASILVLPSDADEATACRFLGCRLVGEGRPGGDLPPRLGGLVLLPAGLRLGVDPAWLADRLPAPGLVVVPASAGESWATALNRSFGPQLPAGLIRLTSPAEAPACAR
ncbi:hypothetical protein LBMAG53_00420 [Planctomycetota bacterium]|nr:hypothetical protein LBMAG53_00420 [Planctomycetota bacterium]